MEQPPDLEAVVAANIARLRKANNLNQEQLAHALRYEGLRWDRATVAGVETGRRQVRLTEAVALCDVLGVSMAELVTPPGDAVKVDQGSWAAGFLRAVVEGDEDYVGPDFSSPARFTADRLARLALARGSQQRAAAVENLSARWDLDPSITRGEMKDLLNHRDPLDVEIATRIENRTRLGVTPGDVRLAAQRLWGQSTHDERERRLWKRSGNVRAVRGRITRVLTTELEKAIEEAADRAAERLGR
jgi:transcriptional regulator with XRE-family HTH domain